jgi:hypothetical protein
MNPNDAQERLAALTQPPPLAATLFPPTSRYYTIGTAVLNPDSDRPIVFLRRRFVPQPERLATIRFHVVMDRERPDHIAAAELGDPELFWRLCDANRATFANELVEEVGRRIRVAMPEGTPGTRDE